MRANVLYAHLDPRGRGRVQVAAELPLIYPPGAGEQQAKLEPQPFLESLPVYRYIKGITGPRSGQLCIGLLSRGTSPPGGVGSPIHFGGGNDAAR
jgi:hypothetical protein